MRQAPDVCVFWEPAWRLRRFTLKIQNKEAEVETAAEKFGPVFLCPYRANGRTFTARIRARSSRHAARKMAAIDWAPDCGPIGTPRLLDGVRPARDGIAPVRARFQLRWA